MSSLWRCTICGYIHTGSEPTAICPICAAGSEYFEKIGEASIGAEGLQEVLLKVPCGLFVVSSIYEARPNGMINNTVFQITDAPLQIILGMDKRHLTTEYIKQSGIFAVNFLQLSQLQLVKQFGFKSGREIDKFAGIEWNLGFTGAPILKEAVGYFECRVKSNMDVGSHLVFLAEVEKGVLPKDVTVLTYQEYREHKHDLWEQTSQLTHEPKGIGACKSQID